MKQLKSGTEQKLLEGEVISCLKDNFVALQQAPEDDRDPSKFLSKKCAGHIEKVMRDEAEDFQLDPQLQKHCKTQLNKDNGLCSPVRHSDPIECLKTQFMNEEMKGDRMLECRKYVARLIKESQV